MSPRSRCRLAARQPVHPKSKNPLYSGGQPVIERSLGTA
ncbi:bacteriophage protein [Burkholderia multivorans ATCC 17616]|uniref:Bacteriophage protein n=1 Tax=Burkholderia multivorans (strain ATCC 17616 / 249) TaxID=395019 RepID=A0A0H3KVY0_BURM1|nr:gp25 [Burkholderia phage Bcep176]ABA60026.1 gp25 [Burkholderia phage Bcep176]BAG46514.1 bacteriophage protein [Burkholderia multivorans ATCC 17616]